MSFGRTEEGNGVPGGVIEMGNTGPVPDAFIDSIENILFHLNKEEENVSDLTQAETELLTREFREMAELVKTRLRIAPDVPLRPLCPVIRATVEEILSFAQDLCTQERGKEIDDMLHRDMVGRIVIAMYERENGNPESPWYAVPSIL
jgi:hypothetical protein